MSGNHKVESLSTKDKLGCGTRLRPERKSTDSVWGFSDGGFTSNFNFKWSNIIMGSELGDKWMDPRTKIKAKPDL